MNDFHTEDLLKMAKERNQEEVVSQFVRKAIQGSSSNNNHWLVTLGSWMVANGEKLQACYAASLQTTRMEFSQSKVKKVKA